MTHSGTPWPPSCGATEKENYSVAWHVVALFVILNCSLLGTVLPMLGKRVSAFRVPEYAYAIGKSVATGVVLGVALIHMLKPANESFTSECMPNGLSSLSEPLAYIICIASVAAMHSLEACLRVFFEDFGAGLNPPIASEESQHLLSDSQAGGHHLHRCAPAFYGREGSGSLQILSAVLLEFGVSLHSLFVGLTVGMCANAELYTLTCALSFHQFFEGVALGSRLVDAALTLRTEYVFAAVFVLSAPFGAAVGIMCVCEHMINTKGSVYLLTQGILDSVCAGILLYIGFQLLVVDFYADMRSSVQTVRSSRGFLLAMLVAFWAGVSIMALIGLYV
ncbi:putative cation transporter [Leishmania mexicana MHOM/GT/2001/U1103]|uniref:Cation transporter n=1 Tax=Leishmania mexicana (strain MHOM/GT/2001/U1103) TaxID=929439 RepID=E9B4F9_LEIMU|nr:putative cation transporter [Leishmania mexicana MHOM/GT/2001/U1103]CBZ30128.1 putative cation transporter [Leishmania mexicana MHOM/GT/2001/U1103]